HCEHLQRLGCRQCPGRRDHTQRGAADHGRGAVKIVAICGAGIGSSAILKVNAERVLRKLGHEAEVVAADIASVVVVADDAQVILNAAEYMPAIGKPFAEVIVVKSYFDTNELETKLRKALD